MIQTKTHVPAVDAGTRASEKAGRPPKVTSRGLMVKRARLLQELKIHGPEAGITVVCAPQGMGKTALLLQYVEEVKTNPTRGSSLLLDVCGMTAEELYMALRRLPERLSAQMHPLVAIDNMPVLGDEALEIVPTLLRDLRGKGFEFILACSPTARELLNVLGDSYKIGAQALVVRPREYSDWTQAFAIDRNLDVYELTQGVPSLVAALQTLDGKSFDMTLLVQAAMDLYGSILRDLRHGNEGLYRLACLLLLTGEGEFSHFTAAGLRIREETISRLARDYPVFGIDAEHTRYACMVPYAPEIDSLRAGIAKQRTSFAKKALQVLMITDSVDAAVKLAGMMGDRQISQQLVADWPLKLVLGGNASFVMRTVAQIDASCAATVPVSVVLSMYAASLVSGEYRTARSMAAELHRRAANLKAEVPAGVLATAFALADIWSCCPGVALPELVVSASRAGLDDVTDKLQRHRIAWESLVGGDGHPEDAATVDAPESLAALDADLPSVLLMCDDLINLALHGDLGDTIAWDRSLQALAQRLHDRRADPFAALVRMTAATCRIMTGTSIVDERAYVDAGTAAVRSGDFPMQLFCLLGEGWQALDEGQVVNARFRAQQVLRLADESQGFLRSWATLLERAAFVVNTAKFTLGEEADYLDLSRERVDSAEAWAVALVLSAAGYASELSAWYSMHKAAMLEVRFRPMAQQAMRAVGDRADAIRCMLPPSFGAFGMGATESSGGARALAVTDVGAFDFRTGQIEVNLFGGFKIKRNGHVLTDALWRRKRLCVLTARLVLARGAFVDRHIITGEMWPTMEYAKSRENLYTALSALRAAFGQQSAGPQYLLTQGEGIAINGDYIVSDVARFDMLARDILLKRTGTSGRQIIESCLKLEELYAGPLYVAELGDASFHTRMRKLYLAKFVDCMLRGVESALALEDLPTASWLIEAALRQAPYREDAMRQAMHIYDRCGRRREIVEMYNAHLHYLQHVAHAMPEDETRLAYESIMGKGNLTLVM